MSVVKLSVCSWLCTRMLNGYNYTQPNVYLNSRWHCFRFQHMNGRVLHKKVSNTFLKTICILNKQFPSQVGYMYYTHTHTHTHTRVGIVHEGKTIVEQSSGNITRRILVAAAVWTQFCNGPRAETMVVASSSTSNNLSNALGTSRRCFIWLLSAPRK